jgi:hypothetical protein
MMIQKYISEASSADFNTANRFASAAPSVDVDLAAAISGEQALELVGGVVRAAEIGAFGAQNLRSNGFKSIPQIATKARIFCLESPDQAEAVLAALDIEGSSNDFVADWLPELEPDEEGGDSNSVEEEQE